MITAKPRKSADLLYLLLRGSPRGIQPAAQGRRSILETARATGQLTDERALVYRVYAAYGWPLLPAQDRVRIDVTLDSSNAAAATGSAR